MAWSTPRTWIVGEIVTHTVMNTHWRDQIITLDNHGHSGNPGSGASKLAGVKNLSFSNSGTPDPLEIRMNGTSLEFREGGVTRHSLNQVQAEGTASLRELGTDGTQISDGTHTHFTL